MPFVSMKLSRDQEEDEAQAVVEGPDHEYPFGLRLMLDDDSLQKLGMERLPEAGTELGVEARAKVVETAETASESESNKRLELQITDLNLIDPDASTADRLFSGKPQSE